MSHSLLEIDVVVNNPVAVHTYERRERRDLG